MRFRGLVYRVHNPRWSWTPCPAREHIGTEGASTGAAFRRSTLRSPRSPPYLKHNRQADRCSHSPFCAYEVGAEPVFDALDIEQCQALDVRESDLACPVWEAEMLAGAIPASHSLADTLVAAGYTGMLVQSFAIGAGAGDFNLVMWHWGADRPSRVTLIDDEGRLRSAGRTQHTAGREKAAFSSSLS